MTTHFSICVTKKFIAHKSRAKTAITVSWFFLMAWCDNEHSDWFYQKFVIYYVHLRHMEEQGSKIPGH